MKTLKQLFEKARNSLQYQVQGAIMDFTEGVAKVMKASHTSKTELARRLDCSQAFVTKILRGQNNFTLETMVKIARALDAEVKLEVRPKTSVARWNKIIQLIEERPERQSEALEYSRFDLSKVTGQSSRASVEPESSIKKAEGHEEVAIAA
jgi:plasmid maintenance system antidote protein VapI